MKMNPSESQSFESTYALIVRSEERPRNTIETLVYAALIASTFFALSQFGRQPFTVPIAGERAVVHLAVAERGA